jgi:hypothetical protein
MEPSPEGTSSLSESGQHSRGASAGSKMHMEEPFLLQTPMTSDKPTSLSDLAQLSSSAESSQSSLHESQIIKSAAKNRPLEGVLEEGIDAVDGLEETTDQEGSQSQGWLRRSTRRSVSGKHSKVTG